MRTPGSASELERQRYLAVAAVKSGYDVADVAIIFKVHTRTLYKWLQADRKSGAAGLKAKPAKGRRRKLSPKQERTVLSWFTQDPRSFGFRTELWTAPRVRQLIHQKWGIAFHERYLNHWLAIRHITPQKPERQARERDPKKIAHWLSEDWPRIQKKPTLKMLTSY